MHALIALLLATASPAPRPTLPPVIYHVVAKGANPHKACGIYTFAKAVRVSAKATLVVCKRPKGAVYF